MKNYKKIIVFALAAVLICSVIPMSIGAAPWDGTSSVAFAGGTGTENDPFIIETANQLAYLANSCNSLEAANYKGIYFKLSADIDLAEQNWTPIGISSEFAFKGIFDGNGHKITGLKCDNGGVSSYGGLFGRVSGATIKNVTVEGSLVEANDYVGGIAGYALDNSSIINCHTDIKLIVTTGASITAGGIVGRMQFTSGYTEQINNKVILCTSNSNVGASSDTLYKNTFVGGIAGVAGAAEISFCTNNGNIYGDGATTLCLAGGVVGCLGANSVPGVILFCQNTGDVTAYKNESVSTYAGGICGRVGHVAGGATIGNISVGDVIGYINDTQTVVNDIYGGVFGHARKICNVFCNYTSMEIAYGYDEIATDEDAAVTVGVNILEGMDVFNTVKSADTMGNVAALIARYAFFASECDYDAIPGFEAKLNGKSFYEYIGEQLITECSLDSTTIYLMSSIGELPIVASDDACIKLAESFEQLRATAVEIINAYANENKETATPTAEVTETPTVSVTDDGGNVTNSTNTSVTNVEPGSETGVLTEEPKVNNGCKSLVGGGISITVMAMAVAVALKKRKSA